VEYWSHQQTYVSTGFGDLSFAPCPRLNLDKPGERPTRFNSKRQECFLGTRLLLLHSRADSLVTVSRGIYSSAVFLYHGHATQPIPGLLECLDIKPLSLYIVDESPSNRCNLGYRSLTVRAKRMPERTRVDRVVL
jgi:hypothetical protein